MVVLVRDGVVISLVYRCGRRNTKH